MKFKIRLGRFSVKLEIRHLNFGGGGGINTKETKRKRRRRRS